MTASNQATNCAVKIIIFPDRIYKDPRANAPCPLDHSNAANWANVIVYSKDAHTPPSHRTSPLSIKCVFHGREIYEIEGIRYAVDDKSYLIVNHQQPYAFGVDSQKPFEALSIFFEPEFVREVLEGLVQPADKLLEEGQASPRQPVVFFEKLYPHDQILSPMLFKLNFLVANGAGTPGYFAEQFVVLLEKMLQAHRGVSAEIARLPAFRFSTRVEIYRRLHRAKDFIDSCYQQPIQLPQIARIAQLSRYHFLRLFKTAFNETPYQYLTHRRLETARTLLAKTDLPITQVCYEAGFEDLSSFGRLFRRFSGLSPKAFRRHETRLNEALLQTDKQKIRSRNWNGSRN